MTKPDGASKLAAVTMAPGDIITCKGRSRVTQADLDQGFAVAGITVTGTDPDGETVTGEGMGDIKLTQHPGFSLTKTADKTTAVPGDLVTYTITAVNSGDTTLVDVIVTDAMPGLSPLDCTWPGDNGTLAVGQQLTCTATYTVTEADAQATVLENDASATGHAPGSPGVTTPSGEPLEPATAGSSTSAQVTVDIPIKPADDTGDNGNGGTGDNGNGGNDNNGGQTPTNGTVQTGGKLAGNQTNVLLASMMFVALSAMAVAVVATRRRWRTTRE